MLDHFLNLWVAIPCSASLILGGSYLWISGRNVRATATGVVIDLTSPRDRARRALALTGKLMTFACAGGLIIGLLVRLAS